MHFDPWRNDWVMHVDSRRHFDTIFGAHGIGRWWCDNRASQAIRRMLWEGVYDPTTITMLWIERFDFNDEDLERMICREWSTLSGSSVPYAGRAGSNTQVKATKAARNIATGYSRHRMKRMVVPTVMSGGVRK